MRAGRRGIAVPAVLGVVIALAALASLGFEAAISDWRVAALARDHVIARAAALEGVGSVHLPPDLAGLCLRSPLAVEERAAVSAEGAQIRSRWRHLGGGVVRGEVEGWGPRGARHRFIALLRPDSAEWGAGLFTCPAAGRLAPLGPGWLEGYPEG